MTVLNAFARGYTAMPYSGTLRCGYMRYSHHNCPESGCPLNNSLVMVLARTVAEAHAACHQLWATEPAKQILVQRLTVATETMVLDRNEIETGIVDGDPRAWARFRTVYSDWDSKAVQLPNIDALISFPNSPASIWQMHGEPMPLPWHGVPRGGDDESWAGLLDSGGYPLDPGGMINEALEDQGGGEGEDDPQSPLGL